MSSPQQPPQTPPTPTDIDGAASPSQSDATAEATGNGTPQQSVEGQGAEEQRHEEHRADEEASDAAAEEPGEVTEETSHDPAAPAGEKKRRRRRRKKKAGAHPSGATAPGEASSSEAPAEPSAEGASTPGTGEATSEAPHAEKKDRKKDKRHGPPRERPPVNAGDIVFGKIVEITDEAIFVDIPGKARAIFDRREMMLVDDDTEAPAPTGAAPAAGAPPTVDASSTVEDHAPPAAIEPDAAAEPVTEEAVPNEHPVDAHAEAVPVGDDAEVPPPPEPHAAPEPIKEPKVPRVILEVGAEFIGVVHNDGGRGALVVLTHHPHRAEKAKPVVEKAFQDKATILALVTGVIKGGIEVDVDGLRAFAPGSHVDLHIGADLSYLVGKRLPFFVTQYAKRGRDVVLSRKTIIEEEARKARTEALARLKVGEELDGLVRSVVPFGAFVDVGGVEGLVPLQEMSHNRGDGPSDVFKAGEPTRVKVIKIDDRGKVWLSRKATIPDPWQAVAQKYAMGTRHTGKVVRLQPFGAFIELEPGVDGLIHTQDLSIKRIEAPGDVVKVNDPIEVVVAHLDPGQHKIGLHPAPQGDQASETPQRVALHKPVKARIMNIESGGLVVRILGVTGRNARGYITSAATGTPRGTELRKAFNVGHDIEAKVVEVDPRRGEVKLSIKALSDEQERSAYQQYRQQLKAEARFTLADLITKNKGAR
jgi:small subunit ribosomal protein S1